MSIHLILLLVALILFIIAGLGVNTDRYSVGWFGLAFMAAAFLF